MLFSHPCAGRKQGTSWFQSFCGCRRADREATASFLTHTGHSLCNIYPTTSACCLWEIWGMTPFRLQDYLDISLQSQTGCNCRNKGSSFPFSVRELRKHQFTKPSSDKVFSSTPDQSERSVHIHHTTLPKHKDIGRPWMLQTKKARAWESCNGVPEATEGLTARKSCIWISLDSPICLITA